MTATSPPATLAGVARVSRDAASEGDRASASSACAPCYARLDVAHRLSGRHGHRHQRQGLDLRDAGSDAALRRLSRPGSTRRRISCATTSACASTARRRATPRCARRSTRSRTRATACRSPTSSSARSPRCGCSRAPASTSLVLEVGLGGRLDAVNIVDADVAVVTSVDHRSHRLPRARRARTSAARRPASSAPGGPRSAPSRDPPRSADRARARASARRCC